MSFGYAVRRDVSPVSSVVPFSIRQTNCSLLQTIANDRPPGESARNGVSCWGSTAGDKRLDPVFLDNGIEQVYAPCEPHGIRRIAFQGGGQSSR